MYKVWVIWKGQKIRKNLRQLLDKCIVFCSCALWQWVDFYLIEIRNSKHAHQKATCKKVNEGFLNQMLSSRIIQTLLLKLLFQFSRYFWDGAWNSTIVIAVLVFCTISLKYDIKKPLPFWHVFYCKFVPFFSVIKKIPVCMWNVPIWARFCPMKIWQGSEQRISHNHNCFVITPERKIKSTRNKMGII